MFFQISSWPISFMKPPISVSAVRGTGSPVIGFLPSTAISRSQPRVPSASFASGIRIASLMNLMIPESSPFAKLISLSIGPVKMRLARSQTSPRCKRSRRPSESTNSSRAALNIAPVIPSVLICCSTQFPTLSKIPWLSSACVISAPPGMNSIAARRMFVGLRSTLDMLIGLIPITIVNIRKPGMMFALSAK